MRLCKCEDQEANTTHKKGGRWEGIEDRESTSSPLNTGPLGLGLLPSNPRDVQYVQVGSQALVIFLLRLVQRAHETGRRSFSLYLGLCQLNAVGDCSSPFYTVGTLNHNSPFPRGPLVWEYCELIKYSNSKLTLIPVFYSLSRCLFNSSASLLSTA